MNRPNRGVSMPSLNFLTRAKSGHKEKNLFERKLTNKFYNSPVMVDGNTFTDGNLLDVEGRS